MRSGGVRQARPRILCALTLLLVVLLAAQPAGVQGQDSPSPFDAAATQVVADITAGALSQVRASFDPTMAAQLPEDQLANAWRTYQELLGEFQSADSPTSAMQGALTVEQAPVHMTYGAVTKRFALNP